MVGKNAKDEIKKALDIVEVINSSNYLAYPLQQESEGIYRGAVSADSHSGKSFVANQTMQVYYDFAEGNLGGDIFDWIALINKLDIRTEFPKVLKIAADMAGIQIAEYTDEDVKAAEEKQKVQDMLTKAAEVYHKNLTPELREFINKKWGITNETIDKLKIGYAKPGKLTNLRELTNDETILKTGLLVKIFENKKDESVKVAELFQGRIVFPYWNSGKVVAFAARGDDKKPEDHEVLKTPDNEYETSKYKKLLTHSEKHDYVSKCVNNHYIWGEDTVRGQDYCVVTEGIADAIVLMQYNIPVLSPVTTKFAKHDIENLLDIGKRLKTVYICNDNEKSGAGEEGALKTGKLLKGEDVEVKIIQLPRPEGVDKIDVAEFFLNHTLEEFEAVKDNSETLINFLLAKIDVGEEKADKIKAAKQFIKETVRYLRKDIAKEVIDYSIKDHPKFKLNTNDTRTLWDYYKEIKEKSLEDDGIRRVGSDGNITVPFDIVANRIMKNHPMFTMDDTREIYLYRDGVYSLEGTETIIKAEARNLYSEVFAEICIERGFELPDHLPVGGIKFCNEVLEHIRVFTSVDRDTIEKNTENIHLINMENCIFDFDTGKTLEHDPKYKMTRKIPVIFDPKARCPKTVEFLTGIMNDGDVQTMLEFIGYCFLPEEKFQKGVMMQGEGENGKSLLLKLITKLVGDKNAAAVDLQSLCSDRFAAANLHGKLINIYPDMSSKELEDTNMFKAISTGDRITAQKKFGQPFEFYNVSKQLFSVNNVPYSKDDSYAYYRRWLYVEFPWKFVKNPDPAKMEKKGDPDLFAKITTQEELSGFFNLAVVCGSYLYSNGYFSYGSTVEEVKERMTAKSDPIRAFIERYTESTDLNTSKAELYEAYKRWTAVKGIPAVSQIKFGKRLRNMGVSESRPRDDYGEKQNMWEDISLKDEFHKEIPQLKGATKLLQFESTKKMTIEPYWKTLNNLWTGNGQQFFNGFSVAVDTCKPQNAQDFPYFYSNRASLRGESPIKDTLVSQKFPERVEVGENIALNSFDSASCNCKTSDLNAVQSLSRTEKQSKNPQLKQNLCSFAIEKYHYIVEDLSQFVNDFLETFPEYQNMPKNLIRGVAGYLNKIGWKSGVAEISKTEKSLPFDEMIAKDGEEMEGLDLAGCCQVLLKNHPELYRKSYGEAAMSIVSMHPGLESKYSKLGIEEAIKQCRE